MADRRTDVVGPSVGYPASTRSAVSPAARLSNTTDTGIRVPRNQTAPCMIRESALEQFRLIAGDLSESVAK